MDNAENQSKVAYGGIKEVNTKRGMPKSKQWEGDKMPQDSKVLTKNEGKKMIREMEVKDKKEDREMMSHHNKTMHHVKSSGRHKEHR
jgi:hypothetical protein